MTRMEFMSLCGELLIDPAIALECDTVQDALIDRDDEAVRQALIEEF